MDESTRQELLELLSHVSRSFTVGILGLDGRIRDEICLAYLLCRIFDTYEDSLRVPAPLRLNCLKLSVDLLESLEDPVAGEGLLARWEHTHDFAHEWSEGVDPWERKLLEVGPRVWREVLALEAPRRLAFRDSLQDMVSGMIREVERRQLQGDRTPRTLEETDRYCYAVAGTVGLLLTALFQQEQAFAPTEDVAALEKDGVDFGKALQLVNILKDFHKDWREGRCYWPGLRLPDPSDEKPEPGALEKIFGSLVTLFEGYARSAKAYALRIDPKREDLRFFCEFPLKMAEATLAKGRADLSWLREGGTFKVNRLEMAGILGAIPRG